MPFFEVEPGIRLYYRLEGAPGRPVLMLSHSLGADHEMWAPQVPALLEHLQLLRYDTRGHGASDAPAGEYTLERLALDALAIADHCQWIAAHHPQRVTHLVLANTSAKFPDPSIMDNRRRLVLAEGMRSVEQAVMGRFFQASSLASDNPHVATTRNTLLATDPVGYAGCCAAVRDLDNRTILASIQAPTLVIGSETDQSTPWAGHGDYLVANIEDAKALLLPTAHISNIERPHSFTTALLEFLVPEGDGMAIRRRVLGDAHVDRSLAKRSELNGAFQDLIVRYAWGSIWTRPGLDAATRRLLVLTATAAMGRWEEFRLHVRSGLARELEACDIREVLLQAAVYAGVPCANTGFQIVEEELAALSSESSNS
jgi:3-oxoadipate enol-lactonase / 4-carboxymuconolactone decarboxylase